ncbi:MAG: hypothetical protein R3C02_05725 [Planctomycetaceae bacterium]
MSDAGEIGDWTETKGGWSQDAESRSFELPDGLLPTGIALAAVSTFHPSSDDWMPCSRGDRCSRDHSWITDFCGYNAYYGSGGRMAGSAREVDVGGLWIADLTTNFELTLEGVNADSKVEIELCDGLYWYRCRIDASTGQATLLQVNVQTARDDEQELASQQPHRFRGAARGTSPSRTSTIGSACGWTMISLISVKVLPTL